MSNIIELPIADRWLFSVDVFRKPGGEVVARLSDIRASDIRPDIEPKDALMRMVDTLRDAAAGMEAEARQIGTASPIGE